MYSEDLKGIDTKDKYKWHCKSGFVKNINMIIEEFV